MILLRRGFARLLHHPAEIVEAEAGGSLPGNGFVLPLIDLRTPILGVFIAGREGQSLVEIGFSLPEIFKLKVSPTASCIGLLVSRILGGQLGWLFRLPDLDFLFLCTETDAIPGSPDAP